LEFVHGYFLGLQAIIKHDDLIRLFGTNQLLRMGDKLRNSDINNIRNKLRSVARLLKGLREKTETFHNLSTYIDPKYYDSFVEVVRDLGSKTSSQLALTLGHYIKQLTHLHIAAAVKSADEEAECRGESFLKLYRGSWGMVVASAAAKRQRLSNLNESTPLPTTQDLVTLTAFLKEKICKIMREAEPNYVELVKLVVSALIVFNKRRPMEVLEIKLTDYQLSKENQEEREEIMNHLSVDEKIVANR